MKNREKISKKEKDNGLDWDLNRKRKPHNEKAEPKEEARIKAEEGLKARIWLRGNSQRLRLEEEARIKAEQEAEAERLLRRLEEEAEAEAV